jgi:uncharacterized protein YutE (UPF0331/DUF86 family)
VTHPIVKKAESIERCVVQIRRYQALPSDLPLAEDFLRLDAITLNIQRACDLAVDMAQMLVRDQHWGMPSTARDAIAMLATQGVLNPSLAARLGKAIQFRNIAVHQYTDLKFEIIESVLASGLDDLLMYTSQVLRWLGQRPEQSDESRHDTP